MCWGVQHIYPLGVLPDNTSVYQYWNVKKIINPILYPNSTTLHDLKLTPLTSFHKPFDVELSELDSLPQWTVDRRASAEFLENVPVTLTFDLSTSKSN